MREYTRYEASIYKFSKHFQDKISPKTLSCYTNHSLFTYPLNAYTVCYNLTLSHKITTNTYISILESSLFSNKGFIIFINNYLHMASMGGFAAFLKEYNIAGMAVAFVMGAKTAEWVGSLMTDVVTPALLAPAMKRANVETLGELVTDGGIRYGNFLSTTIDFLVVAFIMYLLVTYLVKKFFPADEE